MNWNDKNEKKTPITRDRARMFVEKYARAGDLSSYRHTVKAGNERFFINKSKQQNNVYAHDNKMVLTVTGSRMKPITVLAPSIHEYMTVSTGQVVISGRVRGAL